MPDHQATYSPEDDKLRLYFAFRIPRPEWDALRAEGWTWTMKQAEAGGCDMVAMWSPSREDKALELAGEIGDEDQPRAERAAQRAERFEAYGDKREGEAIAQADRYEAGPSIHAAQSAARAERSAARHDRVAGRAVNLWSKAEYWTRRTAGVIAHALYKERADVRHRRIKGLEADIRKQEKNRAERQKIYDAWKAVAGMSEPNQTALARRVAAVNWCHVDFPHPTNPARRPASLHDLLRDDQPEAERITGAQAAALYLARYADPSTQACRYLDHLRLRLAYEQQMLAAQGGTSADVVEMEAGGFIGSLQVRKVTKDRAGRVSKLYFRGKDGHDHAIRAESVKPGSYRAPTDAERAAFKDTKPKASPLINPTKESAQAWCDHFNAATEASKAKAKAKGAYCSANYGTAEVRELTAKAWTALSRGGDSYFTREYDAAGNECSKWDDVKRESVCRLRMVSTGFARASWQVVVLTDKPQVALPFVLVTETAKAEA